MIPNWQDVMTRIPRLEAGDWQAMGALKRWFVATRAAVLVMTLFSAGIGLLLAAPLGPFDGLNAALVCLGLVLAHATNNLINDWTDSARGVDRDNYFRTQYGPQPLEEGLVSRRRMLGYIAATGALAIAIGLLLVVRTGAETLYWMLAGAFFVLFYTWPLKYIGLGEPAVWLVWGPLMVLGTAVVVAGSLSAELVWVACLYGLGPTTVLLGKHTDKLAQDRAKGVHTLPVLLGEAASRHLTLALWLIQYAGIVLGVALGALSPWYLLVLLALPRLMPAWRRFRRPRPTDAPTDLPPGVWPLYLVSFAFAYNKAFSGLLVLAILLRLVI